MSTMIFKEEQVIRLCRTDAKLIRNALSISKESGIAVIKEAISGFIELLEIHKKSFVPNLDLDYKTYIANLLELSVKEVREEDKAVVFREIVIPN